MFNADCLKTYLSNFQTAPQIWIAYSGGLDSSVLLHAMAKLASQEKIGVLKAVHINHGWHADAENWAEQCRHICEQLKIPCHVITVNAQSTRGESPEACARAARYAAFTSLISPGDYLLTAHQQDDQAETLLLQLFRGAGVKGLSSMPALIGFTTGYHLRPLLNFTRKELEDYAQQNKINWIEDDSNKNLRFDRNLIRHELMPHIQQRWPQVTTTLARAADHCAEAEILLQQLAQEDLLKVQGTQPNTLSINKLLMLNKARWQNVFRHWLHNLKFSLPSHAQLKRVANDILQSKTDANPNVSWGNVMIRRYRGDVYALAQQFPHDYKKIIPWDFSQPLALSGIGVLSATLKTGKGIDQAKILAEKINVRFRVEGERCQPVGRQGSHPLKKLLQEWNVPPWQRDRIPLIYCGNDLVAVVGYCICTPFAAQANDADEFTWSISLLLDAYA